MKYIYIFDFTFCRIYEAVVPETDILENMNNIEGYLIKNFGIRESSASYMISDKKLKIEEINKSTDYHA